MKETSRKISSNSVKKGQAFLASHQTPHSIAFLYGGAYGVTYMKYLPILWNQDKPA